MRVAVSGYYGFGNLGDEAILSVLLELFQCRWDLAGDDVCVLSGAPKETARIHNVRAIGRTSPRALRRELRRCDLFVSGGGGLIQDRTSRRSAAYYLGLLEWSARHAPVVLMGQGLGPLSGRLTQRWARRILPKAQAALVRDEASARLLGRWGLPHDRLFRGSDLTLLRWRSLENSTNGHVAPSSADDADEPSPYALIALRGRDVDPSMGQLRKAIAQLTEQRDMQPALVAMHPDEDRAPLERLADHLGAATPVLDPTGVTWAEAMDCFRGAEVIVGNRLHALVFALLAQRPFLALGGERKIARLLRDVSEAGGPDVPHLPLGDQPARPIKLAEAIDTVGPWNDRWDRAREALACRTERAVDGFFDHLGSIVDPSKR